MVNITREQASSYVPDYLVTPGEVLEDYLDNLGMKQSELAARTGLSKKTINEIVKAKAPISPETALKFERVLGRPAHFWSALERQYQDDKVRLAEQEALADEVHRLKDFPIKTMIKHGWLEAREEATAQLQALLKYFGVASLAQWDDVWGDAIAVNYRQSNAATALPEAIAVWLQQGAQEAQKIPYAPYDKAKFSAVLTELRALTRCSQEQFMPELIQRCAAAGVAVVIVPALPNTRVYGCSRWLHGTPIIQLSGYYKRDDQFWFTVFHEAAHILKHSKKDIFIQDSDAKDAKENPKEEEANTFAANFLIAPKDYQRFIDSWDGESIEAIESYAQELGIAAGILAGRLEFDGRLSYRQGGKLKVSYDIEAMLSQVAAFVATWQ